MTLYVSWPRDPAEFRDRTRHHGNAHQAHHYLNGLRERFENVEWLPWGVTPAKINSGDWLVCHPDWQGSIGVQQAFHQAGGRVFLIMNDPIYNYAWGHGSYDLHGYDGFDKHGLFYSETSPNGHAVHLQKQIHDAAVTFCHSNQVVIDLWERGDFSVTYALWMLQGYNFHLVHAPTDTEALNREVFSHNPGKFLVYSGQDVRKQPQLAKEWLAGHYLEYGEVNWFDPSTYNHILKRCSLAVSPSLQEAFPYFALECLSKGLIVMGGEDWWHGWGYEALIWRQSADGSTYKDNCDKIRWLLSDSVGPSVIYQDVQRGFRADERYTWKYFMDRVANEILRVSIGRGSSRPPQTFVDPGPVDRT